MIHRCLVCFRFTLISIACLAFSGACASAPSTIQTHGTQLPTSVRITPVAAPGAQFKRMNPDLPGLPDFQVGQAVSTALSPDGHTLLVLTSGYNRNRNAQGKFDPATSAE